MIKKTIKYKDFNDNDVTEEFYFHLSKGELINMELSHKGGLSKILPEMIKQAREGKMENIAEIVDLFRSIISASFGKRSDDARRFIKDQGETDAFMNSPPFDALFMELIQNENAVVEFISGIMPKDLMAEVVNMPSPGNREPPWVRDNRRPTNQELMNMSREDLLKEMQRQGQTQLSAGGPEQP